MNLAAPAAVFAHRPRHARAPLLHATHHMGCLARRNTPPPLRQESALLTASPTRTLVLHAAWLLPSCLPIPLSAPQKRTATSQLPLHRRRPIFRSWLSPDHLLTLQRYFDGWHRRLSLNTTDYGRNGATAGNQRWPRGSPHLLLVRHAQNNCLRWARSFEASVSATLHHAT